jgi:hypothetical protein
MEKIFRIRIDSDDFDTLTNFLKENPLDLGCTGGITKNKDGLFSVEAYGSEKETVILRENIAKKKFDKIRTELEDITQYLSDRQKEVGSGDRYKDKKELLRGYGTKVKQ